MSWTQKLILGWSLGAIVSGALVTCGLWIVAALVERAVERDATRRSTEWAIYAMANLQGIEDIAIGSPITDENAQVIDRLATFGGVFRFKLFGPDGTLGFDSNSSNGSGAALGVHNEAALRIVTEGGAFTSVEDGRDNPARPDLYSETYIPIMDTDGQVRAVAETYLDQTDQTKLVRKEYLLFGSFMILLILLAMILPTLALIALFRRLRRRNEELDRERVRAQEADRAKTQFLATISHELRTPMNGIIGAVQLLQMSDLPKEDVELVEILHTCSESQISLIEELLTFSTLEAGRMHLTNNEVDPAILLKAATGFATIAAANKGIAFEISISDETPRILTDGKRLQQIIVNLVGNAVKFTETGNVTMHARLICRGRSDFGLLSIAVTDTGPGIPPSERERIFERFTQVDETSTRKAGGTGLGLAIARGIARAMGGDIKVDSKPGVGSTFRVELPVPVIPPAKTDDILERTAA